MNFTDICNPRATIDGILLSLRTLSGVVLDFHAMPTDTAEYGRELYVRALKGEFGEVLPYTVSIEDIRKQKEDAIRSAYKLALEEPVTCALGTFNGGEASASVIQAAVILSDYNGEDITIITDINNNEVQCNRGQVYAIAAAIGNACRQLFHKKQSLMRDITSATTSEEVNAIVW